MPQPITLDELRCKEPATVTVDVILDGELAARWHDAQEEYEAAKLRNGEKAKAAIEAEEVLEELRPVVEESTRVMRFKALGRKHYDTLVAKYQPTKVQRAEVRKEEPSATLAFNPDTFPPALIAASAIEPELTLEEAQELYDSDAFNSRELNTMFMAALTVNQSSKVVSLGKG